MRLELSIEEAQLLDRILTTYVSDLRMEIGRTDRAEFRNGLKVEQVTIRNVLANLETQLGAQRTPA